MIGRDGKPWRRTPTEGTVPGLQPHRWMMSKTQLSPESLAAQALGWIDETTRAVVPPIHLSTTYLRDPDNQYRSGRIYSRADSPNYNQPEALLARLENGAAALVFSSGMSAAS